jgi:hypothetical protein
MKIRLTMIDERHWIRVSDFPSSVDAGVGHCGARRRPEALAPDEEVAGGNPAGARRTWLAGCRRSLPTT